MIAPLSHSKTLLIEGLGSIKISFVVCVHPEKTQDLCKSSFAVCSYFQPDRTTLLQNGFSIGTMIEIGGKTPQMIKQPGIRFRVIRTISSNTNLLEPAANFVVISTHIPGPAKGAQ